MEKICSVSLAQMKCPGLSVKDMGGTKAAKSFVIIVICLLLHKTIDYGQKSRKQDRFITVICRSVLQFEEGRLNK
jgi:hypothetical protein